MSGLPPTDSLLAGMDPATLQTALNNAQSAYIALLSGQNVVTVSLTQGEGARSVTYRQTNAAQLAALIQQLQRQLGLVVRPRRALRVIG